MAVTVGAQAFFEPARTATIPNVTVAGGAAAGQRAVERDLVGDARARRVDRRPGDRARRPQRRVRRQRAVVLRVGVLHRADPVRRDAGRRRRSPTGLLALTGITDLIEGVRYVRQRSHVAALMFVKAGWGLAGGVLLLLTIFGQRVFPLARRIGGRHRRALRRARRRRRARTDRAALDRRPAAAARCAGPSGPAYFMVGVFYIALAAAPSLWIAALCVLCAHFGGSILWVFSTVLLQMEVPDRFRGRVFATELALVTLMSSASSYWTGYQLDRAGWSPRTLAFALGAMFCVPGVLWLIIQSRWKEEGCTLDPAAPGDRLARAAEAEEISVASLGRPGSSVLQRSSPRGRMRRRPSCATLCRRRRRSARCGSRSIGWVTAKKPYTPTNSVTDVAISLLFFLYTLSLHYALQYVFEMNRGVITDLLRRYSPLSAPDSYRGSHAQRSLSDAHAGLRVQS